MCVSWLSASLPSTTIRVSGLGFRVRGRLFLFAKSRSMNCCKWGSGLLKSRLCFLTSKKHKQDYKQRGTSTWG